MKKKTILLDASSAILLAKAGLHEDLVAHYAVCVAASVFSEVTDNQLFGAATFRRLLQEGSLQILDTTILLQGKEEDRALQRLDRGERDTIRLFNNGFGDFIITDDGQAARFCLEKGIPFVNSLLLLRIFHGATLLTSGAYREGLRKLLLAGRYSEKVVNYARHCAAEDLLPFLP